MAMLLVKEKFQNSLTILSLVKWGLKNTTLLILILLTSLESLGIESVCLPNTIEARNWPVKGLYLHGLFYRNENEPGLQSLELSNRKKIEELALKLKVRIAVPIAPVLTNNQLRQWNSTNISDLEKMIPQICNGQNLTSDRFMIGFSNGAKAVQRWAQDCSIVQRYKKILAIGSPNGVVKSSCEPSGRLVNTTPHVLPELDYFQTHLADWWKTENEPSHLVPLNRKIQTIKIKTHN